MADVRERLEKRNEERLAAIERRKADKESNEQPTETIEYITSTFAKEKGAIEEQLGKRAELIEAGNKMKAVEFFDCLSDKCQKLQKFLADSTMFLPSRDIQVSQDSLKALQQEINEKREEYIPKKKFAFKVRKKESSVKEVCVHKMSTSELSLSNTLNAMQSSQAACEFSRFLKGTQQQRESFVGGVGVGGRFINQ